MLVLKSLIGGNEYVTIQLLHQHMVFHVLPTEIEKGPDVIVRECFDQPRINRGVYRL